MSVFFLSGIPELSFDSTFSRFFFSFFFSSNFSSFFLVLFNFILLIIFSFSFFFYFSFSFFYHVLLAFSAFFSFYFLFAIGSVSCLLSRRSIFLYCFVFSKSKYIFGIPLFCFVRCSVWLMISRSVLCEASCHFALVLAIKQLCVFRNFFMRLVFRFQRHFLKLLKRVRHGSTISASRSLTSYTLQKGSIDQATFSNVCILITLVL